MADLSSLLGAAGIGGAIGQAVVRLELDTAKYQAELKAAEAQTAAGTNTMASSFNAMKSLAVPAMGLAGAAVVAFGVSAVNAASDLNESMNKTRVVFGDAAASVIRFSETSAQSFGISQNAALDAAGGFGAMFDSAGLAEKAAASMSIRMVRLSSDMASFNNTDPSEMLERLRSGLAGEAEPLRRFGVFLSEAAVQSKAMELGLGDATGALTEAEKVQARYAIILEQTNKQQGDFARTSDGLANQQRIMSAQWADLQATLGQLLLPAVTAVVHAFTDLGTVVLFLTGAIEDFDKKVQAAAIHTAQFELDIADFFLDLTGGIPIVGDLNDIWQQYTERQDAAAASTRQAAEALSEGGKGLGNFRGQLFQAQLAADDARNAVGKFAGMTGAKLEEWSEGTKTALKTATFALEDLGDTSDVTGRQFIKAQREMLEDADALSRAMRELSNKSHEWIPDQYLKFLSDQGPAAIVGFNDANDRGQRRLVEQWEESTRGFDRTIRKSFEDWTGVLDKLDTKTTKHTVEVHYRYVDFDPTKPGMQPSGQRGGQI